MVRTSLPSPLPPPPVWFCPSEPRKAALPLGFPPPHLSAEFDGFLVRWGIWFGSRAGAPAPTNWSKYGPLNSGVWGLKWCPG